MSNNLVSQFVQMEHGSNSLDFPVSEMPMKMVGQVSSNPEPHHFYVPADQSGLLESLSAESGFNTSMMPNNILGHNEASGVSMGSNQAWMSDQLGHEYASSPNAVPRQKASYPFKRKAELEALSNIATSQQLAYPYKRPAHVGSDAISPGFSQPSVQRRTAQLQSGPGSPVTPVQTNKKMMRNDSMSGKSGLQRGQVVKRQTTQIGSTSKGRPDSSEAVRSKMRESLAAALALVSQNQDGALNTEKKQRDTNVSGNPMDSKASHVSGSSEGGQVPDSGSGEALSSNELTQINKTSGSQVFSAELPPGASRSNGAQVFQGFQYSLPDEDVSFGDNFFVKDDLLQGNGLSWAFDFDMQMAEGKESQQQAEKPEPMKEEAPGQIEKVETPTPEDLAFRIEAELFKLFGDVNKKYREKGRSLLFNLKDRNNPELRERVMSGKISPERLCSMTAEELASKELSEWRMAKAEELAQMKVLPDTEVDIRRLVRKTHKGEFQVEVEHDDAMAAEVSAGTSLLTRPQRRKAVESHSPSEASVKASEKEKVSGQGSSSEGQDPTGSLIIQTDGTDPMQGMIVDELKDADLPPIVSLDEFMESLNNEPPFDNLSDDAGHKSPISHGESPKSASSQRASNRASDNIRKDAASKKASSVKKPDITTDLSRTHVKRASDVPTIDYVWNGILQLNISSVINVGGIFYSGEKTSIKEWPTSLEIKGRVRLDAFEKFLQELPMSRTRAVMVLHFVLRDKSSDEQRSNLSEAVSSYVGDERLGYAEPAQGIELYLCPPASRMFEMLNKHILQERPGTEKSFENGLIGVVVWRRAHISNTISPNSSSHQKHASKKQPFSSAPKRVQESPKVNPNTLTRKPQPPADEDEDDVPPGFGPGATSASRDDDDLPEFNFSGELTPLPASGVASRIPLPASKSSSRGPVDLRELIKKYGQSDPPAAAPRVAIDRGLGIKPWTDDDDDDIPEWQPQAPQALPLPQPPAVVQLQPPAPPPGGAWAAPPGYQHGARWRKY